MRVFVSYEQDSAAIIENLRDCHVWVVDSYANRAAAEKRWTTPAGSRNATTLTVFDPRDPLDLLATVLEHHPDCRQYQVRGARLTRNAQTELHGHGFAPAHSRPQGFLAIKPGHDD